MNKTLHWLMGIYFGFGLMFSLIIMRPAVGFGSSFDVLIFLKILLGWPFFFLKVLL